MTSTTVRPLALVDTRATPGFDQLDPITQFFLGGATAAAADATGIADDARFGIDVKNNGNGGQSFRTRSGNGLVSFSNADAGNIFTGGIKVTGAATFTGGTISFGSSVTINGNLGVTGTSSFLGPVTVSTGPLLVQGTSTFIGSSFFQGDIGVFGNAIFVSAAVMQSTLSVSGAATFSSNVSMQQGLTVSQSATIVGNATVGGSLLATGTATFLSGVNVGGALNVTGAASFITNVTMTQGLTVLQSVTVAGNLTMTGSPSTLTANDIIATDDLVVTGDLTVTSTSTFTGAATFQVGLTVVTSGVLVLGGGISVTGSSVFSSAISVVTGGIAILAGGIAVTGAASFSTSPTANGEFIAKTPQVAKCSGGLTLTTAAADITGCSISLSVGNWIVTGMFDFIEGGAGDIGVQLQGVLVTTGGTATISTSGTPRMTPVTLNDANSVTGVWYVNVTATTTAKLQALKTSGTGSSSAGVQSTITGAFVGKP